MGNSWSAEWTLDHNRWMWWQCTYSLQGQHCYEAIFSIHKNSYNPAYNLHRIYSPLAAVEVWADSSFVWTEHKENKMTLKSAAHLLKKTPSSSCSFFIWLLLSHRNILWQPRSFFFHANSVSRAPFKGYHLKKKKIPCPRPAVKRVNACC